MYKYKTYPFKCKTLLLISLYLIFSFDHTNNYADNTVSEFRYNTKVKAIITSHYFDFDTKP